MALCALSDVQSRLGGQDLSSDSALINDLIAAAQGHIEREAQRALEADDHTETFDAPETVNVWLTYTPVNSVTSVTVDGTALSSSDYSFDPETGRLTRVTNGRPRPWNVHKVQSVVVVYNGGYETVPEDLKDICARATARAYQAGEAADEAPSSAIKQINLAGSDSVTFASEANDVTTAVVLSDDEKQIARYYRNEVLA